MIRDITIGQYFPGKSAIHKMDPRIKILLSILYIVMLFVADNMWGLLLGVLFGMMRLNFWTYLSASWLSIAPGMVCLCILGNNLDFKSPVFWAMLALNLVLLLGSLWHTRHKLVQSSSRT